jgi:hypothetical protein
MLHYAATNRSVRRQIFATLLGRLNCFQLDPRKNDRLLQSGVPSTPRNHEKRKKYLELTVELVKRESCEGPAEGRLWALSYSQGVDHSILKVLQSQVRGLTREMEAGQKEKVQERLLVNSLLELQREFDE